MKGWLHFNLRFTGMPFAW